MTTTTGIAYGSSEYVELLHKLRAQLSLRADQLYLEIQAFDAPVRLWEEYSDLETCYFDVCDELDRFDPNMAPIYQEERQRIKKRAKTVKPWTTPDSRLRVSTDRARAGGNRSSSRCSPTSSRSSAPSTPDR